MRQGAEQGAVTDVAAEQQGEDEVYHKLTIGDIFATKEQRSEVHRLSRKVLVGTVLFGVAAGFMQTFDSMPQEFATPYFASSLILLILFTIGTPVGTACWRTDEQSSAAGQCAVSRCASGYDGRLFVLAGTGIIWGPG